MLKHNIRHLYLPIITLIINILLLVATLVLLSSSTSSKYHLTLTRWLLSVLIPFAIVISGYRKKSISLSGMLIGVLIGFSIVLSSYCVTVALFVCYITTSKATKFRDDLKRNFEVDFKEGGQRNWIQIVCNLGVACNFILLRLLYFGSGEIEIDFSEQKKYWNSWLLVSSLSAISCALGDTLSSELGSVFCDEPVSVITWNVVPKGTNGGVSIAGFVSATIGGFLIGTSSFISLYTTTISTENVNHTAQWPIIFFCIYASLIGSIIDSILGATLQYTGYDHWRKKIVETPPPLGVEQNCHIEHISGYDLLDNHGVNLLSILIISLINPFFAGYLWPYGTNIFL